MKKLLSILAIALFALSFASCKKCIECSVTSGGVTSTSEETCGKKKDIDAKEKQFMDDCEDLKAIDPDITCECKDV